MKRAFIPRVLTLALLLGILPLLTAVSREPVREHLLSGHETGTAGLVFSSDGKRLAVTTGVETGRRIRIWSVESDRLLATIVPGQHSTALAFSLDGTYLYTGDTQGRESRLWEIATGQPLSLGRFSSLMFAPHEDQALLHNGTEIIVTRIGKAEKSKRLPLSDAVGTGESFLGITPAGVAEAWTWAPLKKHSMLGALSGGSGVQRWAASTNGCVVVTATKSPPTDVQVWNVCLGQSLGTINGNPFFGSRAALSSDGSTLLNATGQMLRMWQIGVFKPLHSLAAGGELAAASPDLSRLAVFTEKGTIRISDPRRERHIADLPNFSDRPAIGFSEDNAWLISTAEFAPARLWHASSGRLAATIGADGGERYATSAAFAPGSMRIAIALADGTVELWALSRQ